MANITYRINSNPPIPAATTVKGIPLTNVEVDANFRAIDIELDNINGSSVRVSGNQTIAGVKTFTSQIVGETNTQVSLTGNQTIAGVKTFASAPVVPAAAFPVTVLQSVPSQTFLGRSSAGVGSLELLNATQLGNIISAGALDNLAGSIKFAIDQTSVANKGVQALHQFAQQEGTFTIFNKGIVSGCTITRSTNATRNLNLAAGYAFALGQISQVNEDDNAVSVPENTTGANGIVFAFLRNTVNGLVLSVTALNGTVPNDGISLYQLTIPAGSTNITDQFLNNVTITDIRRVESGFPKYVVNAAGLTQLITVLPNSNYHITFDIISYVGAPVNNDSLVVISRANNGFNVRLAAAADNVVVRYRISLLNA